MPTPTKLTFSELIAELGCTYQEFPGGGIQVFLPRESRGNFDPRFWNLTDAHVAGTLSGPALHIRLHEDFATLAATAFLQSERIDPERGIAFDEYRDALADAIRQKFGRLVEIALELHDSGAPLPHGIASRLSVELARCDARGITKPANPTPLADAIPGSRLVPRL